MLSIQSETTSSKTYNEFETGIYCSVMSGNFLLHYADETLVLLIPSTEIITSHSRLTIKDIDTASDIFKAYHIMKSLHVTRTQKHPFLSETY